MAKRLEAYHLMYHYMYFVVTCMFLCIPNSIQAQTSTIDSIKGKLYATTNDSLRVTLYDNLSREYLYKAPDSAKFYIDTLKVLSEHLQSDHARALAYNRQGTYEIATGNLTAALLSLAKAKELFSLQGDSIAIAGIYNNLAVNDFYMQDFHSGITNYKKGIKILDPNKHSRLYTVFLTNLSEIYRTVKELDSAVIYAREAIKLSKRIKNPQLSATACFNMGAAKMEQKRYPEALDYLNKALRNNRLPMQYKMLANIHKAGAMIALDRLGEAHVLLKNIHNEATATKDWIVQLQYYQTTKNYYKATGDFAQALTYSESYDTLNERISAMNKSRLRQNLRAKFDLDQQDDENKSLRHEAEVNNLKITNQRNIIWGVGVFIFVLMILLLILNRLYDVNQEANEKLRTKHEVLDKNNKNLEKINNQNNNLFSIVAHDVKSPLSAIMTSINMMKDNIEDFSEEELKVLTQELSSQTENLYGLLEGVLAWTKSQMDGYKFNKKTVKILPLINDLIAIETLTIRKKKLNILTEIDPETAVFADPQAMTVIMRNLINNAIKFTPPGGDIKFFIVKRDKETELAVQDTGLGISQDKIEQIFVKRQRYTRKGTGDEKGNGIGLILCSEIANAMGGGIDVKSTVGRGSTFSLVIAQEDS